MAASSPVAMAPLTALRASGRLSVMIRARLRISVRTAVTDVACHVMTFATRPEIVGTFGVVTSTHWIASAVGMATLERGGNAFDAAVATAFTLQVVEPHLNGPGGDAPVIVYDMRRGKPEVICGQGPAPAGATIAHYRREGL